jgi:hypothetical protein
VRRELIGLPDELKVSRTRPHERVEKGPVPHSVRLSRRVVRGLKRRRQRHAFVSAVVGSKIVRDRENPRSTP